MASIVLDRAVLELGVDGSKLFSETQKAVKDLAARVKSTLGKDLKTAFSGIEDAVGGFKDLAGASNPLASALDNLVGKAKAVGSGFASLGPVAGGIAVALAGISAAALAVVGAIAAAGVAIYNATRSAANAGDELNTLSNRFGMTAEAISTFKFIGEQADVPLEKLTDSIFKLGQNLSEGGKKAQAAARLVGTSIADLRKQSPEQAFQTVITGLGKIPDAGQRAAAGVALFGRQFKDIAQLTQEDMEALAQKARESGAVMSQEFAVAGDRFNDALGVIGTAIQGVVNRFGEAFLPMGIALVETFEVNLVAALQAGAKGAGDFSKTIADLSVIIGQSIAAMVSVAARAAAFLTEFFSGAFITNFGVIELFGSLTTSLGQFLAAAANLQPALAPAAQVALNAGRAMEQFGAQGVKATVEVSARLLQYADAVDAAATKTGITLPAAVARVRQEIKDQADAARKAIGDNTSFGESLGEDVAEGAEKAAAALKKLNEEKRALLAEARAVDAVLSDFGTRFQQLEQDMAAFEAAIPIRPLTDLMPLVEGYSVEAEIAATKTGLLESAFQTLGLTSTTEMQRMAAEAKTAWEVIVQEFGARSPEAQAAYQRMVDAVNAATRTIPNVWRDEVWPAVKDTMANVRQDISQTFAEALVNITSWKDAAVSVFRSFQQAVADILSQILDDFLNRFVKGLTNALTGQGGFGSAFANFLPGLFGGGGNATAGMILGNGGPGAVIGIPGGGAGAGAAATPWWSTAAGGGLAGGAAGAAAGWYVGGQTGNTLGSVGTGAGVGAAVGSIGGPVGAGIGAIIGAGVGWYSAMRERMRTNDERDVFFNQFGPGGTGVGSGFHNVAAQLTEAGAGAGGGQLFQDLINANDTEALAKAIQAVNAALEAYRAKTKEAETATADHKAEIDAITAAHETRMAALQQEADSINDQIADWDAREAPEAVMGQVEEDARAALEKQKQAVQDTMEAQRQATEAALLAVGEATADVGEAARGIAEDFGEGIGKGSLFVEGFTEQLAQWIKEGRFTIPIVYDYPDARGPMPVPGIPNVPMPSVPTVPMAAGGMGMVTRPTLFLAGEAGPEQFAFSGANRAFDGGGGLTPEQMTAAMVQAIRIVGLDKLGTGVGMVDALDRVMPGYVPGMLARNPDDVRTKTQSALGVR